ncbi:hypothetical protein [Sphingomonas aquatilis]|uniref:hypothetical protein n=1 Tax=Sphingomonas aquatilis TaxID=93063 RepID=UPI0023F8B26E|nr:hypothetical protein [Sphingomonas aquatilis]MCI4652600.1 hypothetical protein [Sphingomonas aquatilis]
MNWQVKRALAYISEQPRLGAELLEGDLIRIEVEDQPDVRAVISAASEIDVVTAASYRDKHPEMDFLCGYRKTCVWPGNTIEFLQRAGIGWGSAGTLTSAALEGEANTASHKTYFFADRLIRQYGRVQKVSREYDRIYRITLRTGTVLRIGMIAEYEPSADAVRTLWDDFGPVDIMWNINPNGSPSPEAIDAGTELGCEVAQWDGLKELLRAA